tara:strand:+ start:333 stop:896 length:564 start_codon:yes stop_codon:yes gene_type:complete
MNYVKIAGATVALALAMNTAYAGQHAGEKFSYKETAPVAVESGDFEGGIGLGLTYASTYVDDWALTLSYLTPEYYVSLGGNVELINRRDVSGFNIFELIGDLGLRHRIQQNLFFTYGATGSYAFNSNIPAGQVQVYAAGVATGLQWQPLRHFMVGAQIMPYMYTRNYSNTTMNTFFANGSVTFSYIF